MGLSSIRRDRALRPADSKAAVLEGGKLGKHCGAGMSPVSRRVVNSSALSGDESRDLASAFNGTWPVAEWRELHVLLAVSGGPDSVALLRAALAAKREAGGRGRLFAAHLNHGLRGAAADDQAWVETLCGRFEIPVEVGAADVSAIAIEQGEGWECAARTARYEFLGRTAERLGARFVATGHTADDQVETVLQRFLRGTGVAGLAGMPSTRPLTPTVTLVRPLLGVRRREVLRYLRDLSQDYRHDETNDDLQFTRNRLRHEILPLLRTADSHDLDRNIIRLAQQASEWQAAIESLAVPLLARCASLSPPAGKVPAADAAFIGRPSRAEEVRIDCRPLVGQPELLIGEVCKSAWSAAGWPLKAMGYEEWQRLVRLVTDPAALHIDLPGGIHGARTADILSLRHIAADH
jgi:tRNA(Ile)-lysidine synthase